ncbi:unnamed protein product [Pedinophyceae sp. YPF-701]|nr:unnamed protein product [Pedinophyceae sp. YPF-701]
MDPKAAAEGNSESAVDREKGAEGAMGAKGGLGAGGRIFGLPTVMVACLCYCASSSSMVLANKFVLSSFDFHCPNTIILAQCLSCLILVKACEGLGYIRLEPLKYELMAMWAPANVVFVCMLLSGFFALKHLNVAMVTVLKNCTNLLVITGDYFFYGRTYSSKVWVSLLLMIASAIAGGATDLEFNALGYVWQLINCCFTAGYSLVLRGVMDRVSAHTRSGGKLDEFSMVLYNNLLSVPLLLLVIVFFGEAAQLPHQGALHEPTFLLAVLATGVLGFAISFASLWFLSTATPTIYSLTGSLNKIPLAALGIFLFNVQTSAANLVSIAIGLSAGIVFVQALQASKAKQQASASNKVSRV